MSITHLTSSEVVEFSRGYIVLGYGTVFEVSWDPFSQKWNLAEFPYRQYTIYQGKVSEPR